MDDALTVSQLHRKAKNAMAREFRGYVWVEGEIKNLREHRGAWYISLVEPGEFADGGDMGLDVACWPKKRLVLQAQLQQAGIALAAGMQVRIYGTVTLSKIGRLQLDLHALDTEALVGRQALEKRNLYIALEREGLLKRNALLAVPLVPLRIGLVTSDNSEGFRDFMGQLSSSPYAFSVVHVHAPVQGPTAPALLARAITQLGSENLDLVAVVRGGGGELEAFDKEPVARAIATSPHPIWTGVGHTGDHSVADDVAQRAHITPTACGQAIVETVRTFEGHVRRQAQHLHKAIDERFRTEQAELTHRRRHLARGAESSLRHAQSHLQRSAERSQSRVAHALAIHQQNVRNAAAQVRLLDPKRQLERGYAIVMNTQGKIIRSIDDVKDAETMSTRLADGEITSTVTQTKPPEK